MIAHVASLLFLSAIGSSGGGSIDGASGGGTLATIDAFGRQRVAQPATLFDSKQIFDNQPLFWDDQEISGGGTASAYDTSYASTTLTSYGEQAGLRARQTYMRFNYQPGKSQLFMMTFVLDASGGGTNIFRRVGLFDENNGLFLKDAQGIYSFVVRTNSTGSVVNTTIPQSQWNIDPLDGTGRSGITLDFTKTQILFIDFEWLGTGTVRFGFVIDGAVYYAHKQHHANSRDVVYMATPNLPLRFEIECTGAADTSSVKQICATVLSEGGQTRTGTLQYASPTAHVDADVADSTYAIVGIRLKSGYIGSNILLNSVSLINEQNQDFEWKLIFNPTVAGSFTYADKGSSAVQVAYGATANVVASGSGVVIGGGFVKSSAQAGSITTVLQNALRLGSAIDGTVDEVVLCARPLAANADILGSISWREAH